ncbi:thiF family domain-containing protein [Trichoderma breve]|uniref:ThiF family domain-containing protein n=1 Tax=Trichoderma breve TaxID=2034170 RepID=A0A9W9BGE7_9HYPO|nr:thiF family domain-containing protein [Trichoderma breve]KAJ4860889.1 thiF family domain-containing protein [Trichoderma breve]
MEAPREAAVDAVESTSTAAAATAAQEPQQQPRIVASHPAPPQRNAMATRDRFNHQSLGASLNSSVKHARVLMVGAGGIGCELLKNLVLNGFGEIHIVDLDTIDLSNLNRQFLFRHEHIKKSKSLVAKEAAQRFNPNVKIVAHHANIKDAEFSVPWFRDFKIVFNALDNLDARRHVNKMCLAADVPLIESGTTGFNGQVQVIKKGVTACYDCTPKDVPKSFPVCTIRSTPSQPIHCIVWGKSYLLNEIFGVSEDESAFDHSADADNAQEIEELKKESEALKKIRGAIGTSEFPRLLFDKVFNSDIERLRSVEDMWKSRRAPEALKYDEVMARAGQALETKDAILSDGQKVWSLEESLVVFNDSLDRLSKRLLQMRATKDPSAPEPTITFDKDDDDTLDFVASSANIRSTVFGIDVKSRFDIKQMAGNIIPAIATTNAIVAGLCVLQSFKVLKGEYGQAKEVFLTPFANARLLAPDKNREPNPNCPVCGVYYTSVIADLSRATLGDIVEELVKDQFGYGDKEFVVSNDVGVLYDPDETDNLGKKLTELGIKGGSFLTVTDEDDDAPFVNLVIDIQNGILDNQRESFRTVHAGRPEIPHKTQKSSPVETNGNGHGQQNGKHSLEDEMVEESKGTKRPLPDDGSPPFKKAKLVGPADDVVVVEDAGGAIVIDD